MPALVFAVVARDEAGGQGNQNGHTGRMPAGERAGAWCREHLIWPADADARFQQPNADPGDGCGTGNMNGGCVVAPERQQQNGNHGGSEQDRGISQQGERYHRKIQQGLAQSAEPLQHLLVHKGQLITDSDQLCQPKKQCERGGCH